MKYLLVPVLLLIAGCIPTAQDISILTNDVDLLQGEIDNVQTMLANSEVLNKEEVAKVNETIDKIQVDVGIVSEAIKDADTPLEAVEKGWKASEPFNPYYGYGAAILAGLKLVLDGKKKKELEGKYTAAKRGMDKFRNDNPDKAALLFADIGEARRAAKIA